MLRRTAFALGVLAAGLAACASGPAPRDAYYRLEAAAPPARAPAPRLAGVLEVDRFRADELTGARRLLFRAGANPVAVRQHAYHLWVDPPTAMLQTALAGYLREAGVARSVVTPSARAAPDYVLSGRIVRLERLLAAPARVVVELELSVTREKPRALVVHGSYREEVEASGNRVDQAVDAFNRAATRIFERFLADLSGA